MNLSQWLIAALEGYDQYPIRLQYELHPISGNPTLIIVEDNPRTDDEFGGWIAILSLSLVK